MTNQEPTQEQCDHKHFSPICNSCDTNMIVEAERRGRIDMAGDMRKANNLRQAKIDGKEEWNNCIEQCAAKFEAILLALQHEEGKE